MENTDKLEQEIVDKQRQITELRREMEDLNTEVLGGAEYTDRIVELGELVHKALKPKKCKMIFPGISDVVIKFDLEWDDASACIQNVTLTTKDKNLRILTNMCNDFLEDRFDYYNADDDDLCRIIMESDEFKNFEDSVERATVLEDEITGINPHFNIYKEVIDRKNIRRKKVRRRIKE